MEVLLYDELLGKDLAIYYVSPDWTGVEELDYEVNEGKVSFTVPKLDFYGVVCITVDNGTSDSNTTTAAIAMEAARVEPAEDDSDIGSWVWGIVGTVAITPVGAVVFLRRRRKATAC